MERHQGFNVGVCSGGALIEAPSDHSFVFDHGELVVQLVTPGEAGGADALFMQWF